MNCLYSLSTLFGRFNAAHSKICESIGAVTHVLWNEVLPYFPKALQKGDLIKRIESFLIEKGYDKIVSFKRKRPISSEIKRHIEEIYPHFTSLSKACLTAFKVHLVFSRPLTDCEAQLMIRALLQKLKPGTFSQKEEEVIKRGMVACLELCAFNKKLREVCGNAGVSQDQLEEFLKEQTRDRSVKETLKINVHEMGVESFALWFGQTIGGASFHSAPLIGQIVKNSAEVIGRFSGILVSSVGGALLFRGLSHLMGQNTLKGQSSECLFLLLYSSIVLDWMGWNPITDGFQALSEELLYALCFHTAVLLSGYFGTWAVGTRGALGDYVLNTNRSVAVSKIAVPTFEMIGFWINSMESNSLVGWTLQQKEVIGFVSGHLAYNFEFYRESIEKSARFCADTSRKNVDRLASFYVNLSRQLKLGAQPLKESGRPALCEKDELESVEKNLGVTQKSKKEQSSQEEINFSILIDRLKETIGLNFEEQEKLTLLKLLEPFKKGQELDSILFRMIWE